MSHEPVIVYEGEREWETWPRPEIPRRGHAFWKTLISADLTRSDSLTLGVAKLGSGEALHEHRHEQAEIYFVLTGSGVVTIEDESRTVGPGAAVFIPGNALHACENPGATELRVVYVLAADSFEDVQYLFTE
jgi:mannose-6-phosphate isomerase-like protein (cupin superfamily)